jgi:hypothetical protein
VYSDDAEPVIDVTRPILIVDVDIPGALAFKPATVVADPEGVVVDDEVDGFEEPQAPATRAPTPSEIAILVKRE